MGYQPEPKRKMEQELLYGIAPLAALGIGAGISALGGLMGGQAAKGDKKAAAEAQAKALEIEQQRQKSLEGRFAAQQPLREESLNQLLQMGSTENPFSRRLSDDRAASIMGSIQSLQREAGQMGGHAREAATLGEIASQDFERDKFNRSVQAATSGHPFMRSTGVREAGDVLRHFGFNADPHAVEALINSGQAGAVLSGDPGAVDILRQFGITMPGAQANTPVF